MGIADWFVNNLNSEERILTRDLISIAIADKEFTEEEKNLILHICKIEEISNVELLDSIRNSKADGEKLRTLEEKKNYLIHLISLMSVDKKYPSLEMHIIDIIAKKIGVSHMQLMSFVADEVKDNNFSQQEGIAIIDHLLKYYIATGV